MTYKEILAALAIGLTFYAFVPYVRSIINHEIKPHVFSWVIWALTTFIVFFAQLEGGGGIGALPIGISGLITLYVAYLAYTKKADIEINKLDWFFFISALSSLPFWYFTSDPLWAVIVLTLVDAFGLAPTLRKVYLKPHEESVLFFVLITARNIMVVIALEVYSLTTVLFPATIAGFCLILVVLITYRRRALESI